MQNHSNIIYGGFAQAGSSHLKGREVCQDKFYCFTQNDFTFLSVADGSSSAKFSHLGAENVVTAASVIVKNNFDEYYNADPSKVKNGIIKYLLEQLTIIAIKENIMLHELATTFLFVAIKGKQIIAGHVGDGLIAYRKAGKYKVLSPPFHGEFVNQTHFVTSPNFVHNFRIYKGDIEEIDAIFLMTDGVTQKYYSKKDNTLTKKFEEEITFIKNNSFFDLNNSLQNFMKEKIFTSTNDDSTLVVAYLNPLA